MPPSRGDVFHPDTLPFDMGQVVGRASFADRHAEPEELPTMGQIGRYLLKYHVGQGGLGTVYAAHDPLLSRLIAIKTVDPKVSTEERESFNASFLNEARAAAGLSHPHIVTVFDAGVSPQGAYIAMELLKGRDLRQLREEGWRPDAVQAALIVRRVADALAYAHARGVVHRDVKPANIYMVGPAQPKVLDFGIARIVRATEGPRADDAGGGSPRYMAPEQLRREQTDRRGDVFSLGVVLYELLTEVSPFARPTLEEITQAVVDHDPPPAHLVDPSVPIGLSAIAAHAMQKDPEKRFQSARIFGRELRRWLDTQREGAEARDTGDAPAGLGHLHAVGSTTSPRSTLPPVSPAMAPAPRGVAGRGWTVTGLATIALIASMAAMWFGGKPAQGERVIAAEPPHQPAASAAESSLPSSMLPPSPAVPAAPSSPTRMASPAPDRTPETLPEPASKSVVADLAVPATPADLPLPTVRLTPNVREVMLGEDGRPIGETQAEPRARPRTQADTQRSARPAKPASPASGPVTTATASSVAAPMASSTITTVTVSSPPRRQRREAYASSSDTRAGQEAHEAQETLAGIPAEPRAERSSRGTRLAPVSTAIPTRLGEVRFSVEPFGHIEVDGNPMGIASPLARLQLTEGRHTITLRHGDLAPRRLQINVSPNRPVIVQHRFER